MRDLWLKYQQQLMLAAASLLLLIPVFGQLAGWSYALKLFPAVMAGLCVMALLAWQVPSDVKTAWLSGVIIATYLVEYIGVHSGLLFGDYNFGSGLGYKLFGVPLVIGLFWFLIALSAWQTVSFGRLDKINRFLLAGGLVVLMDVLLEQFAAKYDLWAWMGGGIPIYNYVCWFLLSQLFFYVYGRTVKETAPSLYLACLLPLLGIFFWLMLLVR